MVTTAEAEEIILNQVNDYGTEEVHFQQATGRILAGPIIADRDIPACNRATMDGIAIKYSAIEKGIKAFVIKATQAANEAPVDIQDDDGCIEIMTGAALSATTDTVIRYEDLDINTGKAALQTDAIKKGQNIHRKGIDKKDGDMIVPAFSLITPAIIGAAAFTGNETLQVKKRPRIVVISNGDELTDVSETPPAYKIRRSNSYTIKAALQQINLDAELLHLPDDGQIIEQEIKNCLAHYDALILSGGVSMGKFDLVAKTLEKVSVQNLFHKVQQRPGKPFWFGAHESGAKVFAFPGNPVSTFMCFHRYFVPWYRACMGLEIKKYYAILDNDISFEPQLQYFLQVKLGNNEKGQLIAIPVEGNGSGDLMNLAESDAFMELPMELNNFKKGDIYPVWPFNSIFI